MSELSDLLTALPVPEHRPGFWDELEARLAAVDAATSRDVAIAPLSGDAVPDEHEPSRPARRRQARVAVLAAAAAVVAVIIGLAITDNDPSPSPVITDSPPTTSSAPATTTTPDPVTEPVLPAEGPLTFTRTSVPPIDWSGWPGASFDDAIYIQASDGVVWRTADGFTWSAVSDLDDLGPPGWESNWRYMAATDSMIISPGDPGTWWHHSAMQMSCWSPGHELADLAVSTDGETWELASIDIPPVLLTATELGACVQFPYELSVGPNANGEGFVMTAPFDSFFDDLTYAAAVLSQQRPGLVIRSLSEVDPDSTAERRNVVVNGEEVEVDFTGLAEAERRFHDFVTQQPEVPDGVDTMITVNLVSDDGQVWRASPSASRKAPLTTLFEIPEDLADRGRWWDLGPLGLLNIDHDDDDRLESVTLVDERGQTTWRPDVDLLGQYFGLSPLGIGPDFVVFGLDDDEVLVVGPS